MEQDFDNVAAFDMLHTTNDIQMLKVMLPVLPARKQMQFSVLIKLLELRHVMTAEKEIVSGPLQAAQLDDGRFSFNNIDFENLFEQLSKYAPAESKERFKQFSRMRTSMENMREMQSMMDMMNFAQSDGPEPGNDGQDISEQLKSMMSDEQIQMYEKFKNFL